MAPRRNIQREHVVQKHARLWVREALAIQHEFFAFDRSKKTSQWSHMREKMRGVQAHTPDTLLKILERKVVWCEFKAPGKEPSEEQYAMGARLVDLGDDWFWTTTVTYYYRWLKNVGIPMHNNAEFLATLHDASVDTEIAKAELKAGMLPKRRPTSPHSAKPSARTIARFEKIRAATR